MQKGHSLKPHWFPRLAVINVERRSPFKSVVHNRREFNVTSTKPRARRSHLYVYVFCGSTLFQYIVTQMTSADIAGALQTADGFGKNLQVPFVL